MCQIIHIIQAGPANIVVHAAKTSVSQQSAPLFNR